MEAELAALASSGATSLIGLMVSDSWTQLRDRFARLFARSAATDAPLRELETSRIELVTAHLEHDDAKAATIEDHWRSRLESLLRTDATAEDELRHLLAQAYRSIDSIFNFNSGDAQVGSIVQAGHISGGYFHGTPTAGQRRQP